MHKLLKLLPLVSALFWAPSIEAGLARTGVGLHTLRVAVPGEHAQIVSVPFLKTPVVRGRLQGADATSETLSVPEGSLPTLSSSVDYILRIVGGPSAGKWFRVIPDPALPNTLKVEGNGYAGSLEELSGREAFAIHPLFTLGELLPETDARITAGPIDVSAAQVHFFTGNSFEKFWLSDGTITPHVGWTYVADGELKDASQAAILPGTSFLVLLPGVTEIVERRLVGVVPIVPPVVPLFSGYNFIAPHLSGVTAGIDFKLGQMKLVESGLHSDGDSGSGDRILTFETSAGQFGESFYHDAQEGAFVAEDPLKAPDHFTVQPGEGFIIYNSGDPYLWMPQL